MSSKGAADTQTSAISVGGGNSNFVAASGSLGSSSLSAFAGPWYVETQTLHVDYVRVPREQWWHNTCDATLSGLTTTHSNIQSTEIIFTYTATYDATVVYQNFTSSSVQQPQQFQIVAASGDPNGVNYGALNASTLGPMGSIITSQPYIRRTPYTAASSQPIVSKVSDGSHFAISLQSSAGPSFATMLDGTDFFTDLNFWSQKSGGFLGSDPIGNASTRPELRSKAGTFYYIPGAYNTSKELQPLSTLLDSIAYNITNEVYYAWPVPNGPGTYGFPTRDEGLPEYDRNRHA
jgi:hypothetical protein